MSLINVANVTRRLMLSPLGLAIARCNRNHFAPI
jgi:hypothetical protein